MFRNKSVDVHQFAMIPRADIPRSSFRMQKSYKTTFNSGLLVPIFVEEVLPGDSFNLQMTAFARLATPLFPFMDNLYLESFFFFVPNRLVWSNWKRFMGEQPAPADSISFLVPVTNSPAGGYDIGTVADYMGLPTFGQVVAPNTVQHSSLPMRAYQLIYNEWFRDENLENPYVIPLGDGPDSTFNSGPAPRGKRHDYFTSCLPWTQKGGVAVTVPIGTSAPVKTTSTSDGDIVAVTRTDVPTSSWRIHTDAAVASYGPTQAVLGNLYADLSSATAATINQLRQAFQIQKLLERDARGGTRYTELVRSHFGVISPDARLQRPEYLGGGSTPVAINPIPQTSATGVTGGSSPQGNLSAMGTALARNHGFSQSFTEHGYVIGIVNVRADLTYQQGLRRHWSRSTRYDFYFPVFAMLGEQAVLSKEIYSDGGLNDQIVFGYQERWAEYRYNPSEITGLFRSTAAGTLDAWHLAQKFATRPTLAATFIRDTPPIARVIAVPSAPQFLLDAFFDIKAARPMPMYSVPGMIDHF